MIPIRDTAPCNTRPIMTWSIMAVCSVIFVIMWFAPDNMSYRWINQFGMVPVRYSNPRWAHDFGLPDDYGFSFISNLFLHGDWMHLITNMWFLAIFGDNIEDKMGHWRFLLYYLCCGALATFLQWYFDPDIVIPVVGASGAIAGVLAAYFFLFPLEKVILWVPFIFPILIPIPAIAFLGAWVLFQLHDATTAIFITHQTATVAWWAHLGGFIAGYFIHSFFLLDDQAVEERTSDLN